VLLWGYGGVGKAIAARLAPFDVHLVRVAQRARHEDGHVVHGTDELPELLSSADVVIVSLPLSPATERIIDAAWLAQLPDHALLVNVGRGPLVDTAAMVAAARSGRLRFALDVVDPEPLPADHPLWTCDNVLLSPHVGGATSAMAPRMAALLGRQVERLLRGDEPLNVVVRT